MKLITTLALALALTGCSTVTAWLPSFWDSNQSNYIAQVQADIDSIQCSLPQQPQVAVVDRGLRVFMLYSVAKGVAQQDVIAVVEPLQITVSAWLARGEGSESYCRIKQALLAKGAARASQVVMGRW
jgi:PBP1b-binding outer membrane lipoprotein LpoB